MSQNIAIKLVMLTAVLAFVFTLIAKLFSLLGYRASCFLFLKLFKRGSKSLKLLCLNSTAVFIL